MNPDKEAHNSIWESKRKLYRAGVSLEKFRGVDWEGKGIAGKGNSWNKIIHTQKYTNILVKSRN